MVLLAIILLASTASHAQMAEQIGDDGRQLDDKTLTQFQNRYDPLGTASGDKEAPVIIREFGDYQCPACAQFEPVAKRIRSEFEDTGKVRFIFFDFPLPMHANAEKAAIASRCAARQNQARDYHEQLFQDQDQWADEDDPESRFLDMALENGLDTHKLKSCMASDQPRKAIQKERQAGRAIQLASTPTIMVNDTVYEGVLSYKQLKQAIEKELAD